MRKVAKAHSLVIQKCLKDFAAGKLTAFTPEVCRAGAGLSTARRVC
jgi:hypothetical protein